MSSLSQIVLLIVILTLTFLVCFAAIQVFQILHEAQQTLKRINRLLDESSLPRFEPETIVTSTSADNSSENKFSSSVKNIRKLFHRSGTPLRPS